MNTAEWIALATLAVNGVLSPFIIEIWRNARQEKLKRDAWRKHTSNQLSRLVNEFEDHKEEDARQFGEVNRRLEILTPQGSKGGAALHYSAPEQTKGETKKP